MNLSNFPPELILYCIKDLRIIDLYHLLQLNKYLYTVIIEDTFYKQCRNFYQKNKTELCFGLLADNTSFDRFIKLYHTDLNIWLLFKKICENGDLANAQKIYKSFLKDKQLRFANVFCSVCKGGYLHVAEWILQNFPVVINEYVIRSAIASNNLTMVCWVLTKEIQAHTKDIHISHFMPSDIRKVNVEIIKWIDNNTSIICTDEQLFRNAHKVGYLELIEWFHKLKPDEYYFYNRIPVLHNFERYHPRILQQIIVSDQREESERTDQLQLRMYLQSYSINKYLPDIGATGDIELVKWFTRQHASISYQNIFSTAVLHGHVDLAQWMKDNNLINMNKHSTHVLLSNVCCEGHLDMAKWFYHNYPVEWECSQKKKLFSTICTCERTSIIKWLLEIWVELGEPKFLCSIICSLRKIEIIKYLFEVCNVGTSKFYFPKKIIYHCFYRACVEEDIKFANYLYRNYKTEIEQNNNNFLIFEASCNEGHLETVKWLYQNLRATFGIKFQIKTVMDHARKYNKHNILEWLENIHIV